jgi:hypothetical protein
MAAPSKITATIASTRFGNALLDLAAAGLRTHRSDGGSHGLWLSDHAGERVRPSSRSITGDEVIRACGRCYDRRIADIFPAIKIGPRPGRPLPDPDNKELRTDRDAQSDHQERSR